MPSIVIGSKLWGDMFGTAPMRALFTDEAMVQRYLDVEAALARAQAGIGIVPAEAAAAITAVARVGRIDWDRLSARTQVVGYPTLPPVEHLSGWAEDALGQRRHRGATTPAIPDQADSAQIPAPPQLPVPPAAPADEQPADLAPGSNLAESGLVTQVVEGDDHRQDPGRRAQQGHARHEEPQRSELRLLPGQGQQRHQQDTAEGKPFHGDCHRDGAAAQEPAIQRGHPGHPRSRASAAAHNHKCQIELPQVLNPAQ